MTSTSDAVHGRIIREYRERLAGGDDFLDPLDLDITVERIVRALETDPAIDTERKESADDQTTE